MPSRQLPPDPLTSSRSASIARLRRLHERKGRQQSGSYLAEGPDCVRAALAVGQVIEVLCVPDHPLIADAADAGVPVVLAVPRVVDAAADTRTSQGVVAECRIPEFSAHEILGRPGPVVIADRLGDPGNLGTIVRTAEAVSAAGVILTPGSVDPWNPKAVRASAGSMMRVPIASSADATAFLGVAQETGRPVIALAGGGATDVFELLGDLSRDSFSATSLAWIVGSEAHGIGEELLARADHTARIPMAASVESLNAAIATAVCLYAAQAICP